MAWRLQLKGKGLLSLGQTAENPHQLHLRSGISYPTVKRYVDSPEEVRAYDGEVLAGILINGLGIQPEILTEMKIGDIFELVQE